MDKVGPLLIVAFWVGVSLFALGEVITFIPGAEAGWFAASAVLCLCGVLVRSKAYRIAALCLVVIGAAFSLSGYKHGERYRAWLKQQPSREELSRDLQEDLQQLARTNAEGQHSGDESQPSRTSTNTTTGAAGAPLADLVCSPKVLSDPGLGRMVRVL